MKDLNIRPETINQIEENIGTKLTDLDLRKNIMNLTSKQGKQKQNYLNGTIPNQKSFCTAKETVDKTKSQPTEYQIFANITYNMG